MNWKKIFNGAGTLAVLLFAITLHAQPMVDGSATAKISEHVYVIPDNSVPGVPNVGIIVGTTGTLIIDTGMGKANGEIILEQAKKVSGNNQLYLVTTHIHPEHDLGAHAFPETTKMIRAQAQVDEIAATGYRTRDAFSSRSEATAKLLEGAEFRKADIIFEDQYSLDLGGLTVQLLAMGPNHTPGDTAAYIVSNKVLFTGDIAMQALPAFASPQSSVNHWLGSLDRLEALDPSIVVPSHGPNGNVEFIHNYRNFLNSVKEKTTALKRQGKSLDEVTATVSKELEPLFGNSRRMEGAIRTAYQEANPG
jgi:glyoxylase-like metal-dependent hydrolase (beta-lactamase superfamily II)